MFKLSNLLLKTTAIATAIYFHTVPTWSNLLHGYSQSRRVLTQDSNDGISRGTGDATATDLNHNPREEKKV